jgi:hypothetical protein
MADEWKTKAIAGCFLMSSLKYIFSSPLTAMHISLYQANQQNIN